MDVLDCHKCELRNGCLGVIGSVGASPLMIVGDKPTYEDDLLGEPFARTSKEGLLLEKLLREAGLENPYLTYALKCRGEAKTHNYKICQDWLWQEIQEVEPRVILALGVPPRELLLGKNFVCNGEFHCTTYTAALIIPWLSLGAVLNKSKKVYGETQQIFKKIHDKLKMRSTDNHTGSGELHRAPAKRTGLRSHATQGGGD